MYSKLCLGATICTSGRQGVSDKPIGWLYHKPATGIEFSERHPIKSGEVPDAENVRPATDENLLSELMLSWQENMASMREIAALREDALRYQSMAELLAETEAAVADSDGREIAAGDEVVEGNEAPGWASLIVTNKQTGEQRYATRGVTGNIIGIRMRREYTFPVIYDTAQWDSVELPHDRRLL